MSEVTEDCLPEQLNCVNINNQDSNDNNNTTKNQKIQKEDSNEIKENNSIQSIEVSDIIVEKILTLLCKLIIENAKNLIIDHQTELIRNKKCYSSDVVTILNSLYEFTKEPAKYENKSGFSPEIVNFIYQSLEIEFGFDGRKLIISAIEKYPKENQNILNLIDNYIKNDLNSNVSRGYFVKIDTTNNANNPILVYKDSINNQIIKFAKIPGIRRLTSPRNIIILSKYHDENEEFDHGVLLHRDYNFEDNDFGVSTYPYYYTYENYYSSFNYFFFNYLFKAYWNDRSLNNDFLAIESNTSSNIKIKSVFYITKFNFKCYINFCPINKSIQELANKAIKACIVILSAFPNSILFKIDNPLCAIDFIGNENLYEYMTKIYIINENNPELPIPYSLNKTTLDFALLYSHLLHRSDSPLRFSITGENFYYKEYEGRYIEAKFSNPDINNNNKSVFDPLHPSHIVLLIDQSFKDRPKNVTPLTWLPDSNLNCENPQKDLTENNFIEKVDDGKILNISSQIFNDIGKIEEFSNLFFITLADALPIVSEGTIPEYLYNFVGFSQSEGNVLKKGIYNLIKQFSKGFDHKEQLLEPISLVKISSTDHWKNYPIHEEKINYVLNEICNAIKNHFHINEKNIQIQFIGNSLILLKIQNLPEFLTNHQIINDIWNDEYQPCKADEEIKAILNEIKNIDLQVTNVIHEKSIKIKVFHKENFGIDESEFMNRLNKIANKFGFLKISITDYCSDINKKDIIGFCDVELINIQSGRMFAAEIINEFKNANCIDIKTGNEDISIIPFSNCAPIDEMLHNVKDINKFSTCLSLCNEPQTYLSQCLYAYNQFYFVEAYIMCKKCIIQFFKDSIEFQSVINPETNMIDQMKIRNIYELLQGFLSISNSFQSYYENYPKIPFGQGIWTMLSCDNLISHYIKIWFSININILIRTSPRYFVCCPLHSNIIYKSPKDDEIITCPHCKLFYHSKCHKWHFANDDCPILKENEKPCPNCFLFTEKIAGCSRMTCRCGKHWCFKCEQSPIFDSPLLCYEHMKNIHNESCIFYRYAYHIYLDKQNEKEIVKIDDEKLTLKICVPIHVMLFIHDRQDGNKLQFFSYDAKNLFNKTCLQLPLIIEKIYDYDIVQSVDEVKSVLEKEDLVTISNYFDYSLKVQI